MAEGAIAAQGDSMNWKFYGILLLMFLSSCRNSVPPKIEICILDGFGGGDCVEADGARKYRKPSEMLNYWSTSSSDEANYSTWCYDSDISSVRQAMKLVEKQAKE